MLTDKFIAFLKAILLLGMLVIILLFNTDLPESSQVIEQKLIDDIAVTEEFERLQRNKIIMDATQKYRQQVLEQKQYQHLNSQGQKYIKTLTIQQRKEQQQLNELKQRRLQAELELEKIRREREELSNANYSTN
ncbi:MAG: cell envelope integrity protein TolA [Candidatus Marithrix sp.]